MYIGDDNLPTDETPQVIVIARCRDRDCSTKQTFVFADVEIIHIKYSVFTRYLLLTRDITAQDFDCNRVAIGRQAAEEWPETAAKNNFGFLRFASSEAFIGDANRTNRRH